MEIVGFSVERCQLCGFGLIGDQVVQLPHLGRLAHFESVNIFANLGDGCPVEVEVLDVGEIDL